ncbi:MAG: TonB-dependent receptor [Acidobacteria bacterium]|nr:TonB-dependent receptor [Acidobacteriota bacterium]
MTEQKENGALRFKVLITTALVMIALTMSVLAQQAATSTIEGVVVDPAGAVVPGAKVAARNVDTAFTRESVTDASGIFRLPGLPPGTYQLSASATGFAENKYGNVTVGVGQKLNLDLSLRVNVSETIEVTGRAPIVETSRTQVSGAVSEQQIRDLPVNGRNYLDFVTLSPGVVRDPTRGGDLSFGGQRGPLNSVQVDGVDNNNLFFGQALGRAGFRPFQFSQEAVQEFQVNTNSFSAEFGRAAGGVVNVITKSGTNQFHGTGYEFYRDRALNARNLIRRPVALPAVSPLTPANPKQAYHFHQFGGNIGGPVKKDRAFFFFNYEGQRNTSPNIVALGASAPTDAVSLAGLARLTPFLGNYVQQLNQNVYLGKFDWQIDNSNRLSVRYNHQDFTGVAQESNGPQRSQESSGNSLVKTNTLTLTLSTAFSPRLLNEFRAQIARDKEPGTANSDNPAATVRQGGLNALVIGRNFFSPRETTEQKYQLIDNVTYVTGKHSLRGGLDVNIEKIKNFFPGSFGAEYLFNSYAEFAGHFDSASANYRKVAQFTQAFGGPGTSGPLSNPDFNEFGLFVQDDWRISPRLTLNFGLRYDAQIVRQPPTLNDSPALLAAGIRTNVIHNDLNNFAPRFGFAWRPTESDRLVVRGGYGLFYGRTPAIMLGTAHTQNGLNVFNFTVANLTLPNVYPFRFPDLASFQTLTGRTPPPSNLFIFDRNFQQPYTQQGSFGIEYGLTRDISVSASYLMVKGTHLQRARDINLAAPVAQTVTIQSGGLLYPGGATVTLLRHPGTQGTPTRPIAGFGRITQFEGTANSNYNALVLELNKRFSQNFQVSLSYTWSKIIDDTPDATAVTVPGDDRKVVQSVFNIRDDRALGVSDTPHRLVASGTWDLNYFKGGNKAVKALIGGWQLGGILQANSNPPYSPVVNLDINNDGNLATDRVPGFGRNSQRNGKFVKFDFRLQKDLSLTERFKLQLIGELFNAFNRVNFGSLTGGNFYNNQAFTATINTTTGGATPTAPIVTLAPRADFNTPSSALESRIGQLAIKLIF